MLEVTDTNGKSHYLAPEAIARVSEAGVSSMWHGINAYLKLFDGSTLEVRETAKRIAELRRAALSASSSGDGE